MPVGSKVNKHGLSRTIPESVKRRVRRECGFGCVLCGTAIYEYAHLDPPFADATEHRHEAIALLCHGCHGRHTRGFLPDSWVIEARQRPYCSREGASTFPLSWNAGELTVMIAGIELHGVEHLIEIEGTEILGLRPPEEPDAPQRVSARFFDRNDVEVAQIVDNEWRGSTEAWDIDARGRQWRIRSRFYKVDLVFRVAGPQTVTIDRLHLVHSGVRVLADADAIEIEAEKARFIIPSDLPTIRNAPAFLRVSEGRITVGSDRLASVISRHGSEEDVPGTIQTIGGPTVSFVDPLPEHGPHAGRFPGGKLLHVDADENEGVELTFEIPAGGGPPRLVLPAALTKSEPEPQLGRNDPCFCGSGEKFKKCHGKPF